MSEKCSECFSDRSKLETCLNCHGSVCFFCKNRHVRNNSDHLFNLPVIERHRYELSCKRHHYKNYKKFCNTCSELACIDCLHESHANHDLRSIEDAGKEKRREVANETAKIEKTCQQITNQIEIRDRNYKDITKEVESINNKLVEKKRNIDALICERRQQIRSLLDPHKNETFSAYLQELNQIFLSQAVHTELAKSLVELINFPTVPEYQLVNFLIEYEKYRKCVKRHVTLPGQPSDQYIPMCIVYQQAEEGEINKVIPKIGLTRGMQTEEQSKATHGTNGSTKLRKETNNQGNTIADLQKELESKVENMRSTHANLEQIRKNTRLLVELCNDTQSNVILDQPGILTGQQETNRQIKSIHKDMENVLSYVKNTSEEIQILETKFKKSQSRVAVLEGREKSSSNQQRLETTQRKEVQRLEAEIQKSQERVAQLEDSKKDVHKLEAELQKWRTIAIQSDEREKSSSNQQRLETTQRKEVQRLEAEIQKSQERVAQLVDSKKDVHKLEAELQKWRTIAIQSDERWETTCKEKESLNRQVKRIENEKEDLKTRLSQVAGAKLTAGNSGITDLGDKYRPTRIAEMYSELYDTEWTEAMDDILQLNKWSEESIVQHMFIVLQECFNTCKKIACHQMTELCQHLFPGVETRDMEKYMDIHVTEVKQLRDARKGTATVVGKMLSKSLCDHQEIRKECMKYKDVHSLIIDEIIKTSYGTKCITVCWFMVVQDPEMCLDEHLKHGDIFNKDLYKEYTRSGKKIAYSVWPALYLHKDGPLLTKGVAQAFN